MRGMRWLVYGLAAAGCLQVSGWAQAASDRTIGGAQASSVAAANDAWLAHVRSLYSSTDRDGLHGFSCAVQPDWRTVISSANKGTVDALGERKIAALNGTQVSLVAHMDGTSNIDVNGPAPPADLADVMKTFSDGTKQSLGGFIQFWAPFANESVIPANSQGVDVTRSADGGHVLHLADSGTSVTETFDANDVLREYDVKEPDVTALFTPTFTPTPKGLQVTGFLAHYQAQRNPEQVMQVWIQYSDVGGFSVPSNVGMTLVGSATFDFVLSGCRANP